MIVVRQLKKSFGAQVVLAGVELRIESGESAVIIGRSGGGKSVLLKHVIGLLKPDEGEVFVDGDPITRMNERQLLRVRRKFGMVFQGAALFDSMTVAENVAFGLRRHEDLTEAETGRRVAAALDMVDLPGTQKKKPAELSGGMRKRVGLARAIIYEPQIMLYDEPTTGLDPIASDSIDRLIIRVRDELKVTSVVVTHDMVSAYKVADRIAMLYQGHIIFVGTPEEVKNTRNPYVQQFVRGQRKLESVAV